MIDGKVLRASWGLLTISTDTDRSKKGFTKPCHTFAREFEKTQSDLKILKFEMGFQLSNNPKEKLYYLCT